MVVAGGELGARHEVVVVGGGFGGLQAVRALREQPVAVTLVDRRSFHLFQPLVYQVATGMLAADEIAAPLRTVFRRDRNVRVLLGEVRGFDLARRRIRIEDLPDGEGPREIPYDSVVVAAGSAYSYLGHEDWREVAPDVKSLERALDVRDRILRAFEAADVEEDPARRAAWLTFVIVGAGPTGVELAGQIAEMARHTLRDEYRSVDTRDARILIVEVADRVLPAFPPALSARARRDLEHLGVEARVGHRVVGVAEDCVTVARTASDEGPWPIPARTVVWSAGVVASPLATALATESGAGLDRVGRVGVGPDLTIPGHPEVFAIGDMVRLHDAHGRPVPLPGLAPVAMQQGRHVARVIADRRQGRATPPFRYFDKGNVATIGRAKAVAEIRGLRLTGLPAWLVWALVHIFYLIGCQNRLLVLVRWMFSYLTRSGGARLITGPETGPARAPTEVRPAGGVSMSYEQEQFLTTVAQHAQLSGAAAERATEATLTALAERLSGGEARDLAAKLPTEIAPWLRTDGQAEGFGADEFVRRVAEREGTDPATATCHARAVFAALERAVGPREVADMTSELGKSFAPLLAGPDVSVSEPEPVLPAEAFVQRVADRAGIGEDGARRAVGAVLETLGERISSGEVEDLAARLPEEFHEPLRRGNELSNGAARRMSLDAFVRRIAEREGVTPDEAREQARAVFATLREALPEREFDDVVAQLPRDYAAVTARS